ncbi:TPA: pseudouridine-5'-phosphate glycosidase, partial [Escherichia coli]|nr:pseudouridine-5'-phosphate glycosidase [Escherichia coli]
MSEITISSELLQISPEVQDAINSKKPVVALESTIISHGMPFPQNAQ